MSAAVYLQFSDCGQHVRKWSREPFENAEEYHPRSGFLDLGNDPVVYRDHFTVVQLSAWDSGRGAAWGWLQLRFTSGDGAVALQDYAALPRDSGSDPQGENAGTAVEGEASQSGAPESAHRPDTTPNSTGAGQ